MFFVIVRNRLRLAYPHRKSTIQDSFSAAVSSSYQNLNLAWYDASEYHLMYRPFLINLIVNLRRIQVKTDAIRFFYGKISQLLTPFLCYLTALVFIDRSLA